MLPSLVADVTTSTGPRLTWRGGVGDATWFLGLHEQEGSGFSFTLLETEADPVAWPDAAPELVEYLPVRDLASGMTGYGALISPVMCAFFGADAAWVQPLTSWRTQIFCTGHDRLATQVSLAQPSAELLTPRSDQETNAVIVPRGVASGIAPAAAERLREKSGLDAARLGGVFGVSRVAYQKWIAGVAPQGTRREHLLEVLALIEEAERRLGDPRAVGDWLLTPVSARGRRPLDMLLDREYETFRGYLLHVRTGRERARPLAPSNRVRRRLSREEFDDALARLRPRAWSGDLELAGEVDAGEAGGDPRT